MEPEEIIAIAIREAFKCGKEEGEAYQRMWSNMNEKIEKAKKGEPDYPRGMYDGLLSQLQGMQVKVDPAEPGTEREEVTFQVQAVPGNRIGSEPNEQIAALEKEVYELGRICEEKDAKITDYHKEVDRLTAILKERDAEIAKLRLMVPEVKPSEVYTEEPNKEAYHVMGDSQTVEAPVEAVDPDHCCGVCHHAVVTDKSEIIHCCLREVDYSAYSDACGSFNSKPRKKKLQEE